MLHSPAIFVPVLGKWLQEAFIYFRKGNTLLYFYTDSKLLDQAELLSIRHLYFKSKGNCSITSAADFINIITVNPEEYRLSSMRHKTGRYYYGFTNFRKLDKQIPLSKISRYPSNLILRNDVPGVCIVNDPDYTQISDIYNDFEKVKKIIIGFFSKKGLVARVIYRTCSDKFDDGSPHNLIPKNIRKNNITVFVDFKDTINIGDIKEIYAFRDVEAPSFPKLKNPRLAPVKVDLEKLDGKYRFKNLKELIIKWK